MKITFWGASEDVTGSMTFVHMPEGLVLIDCGLYQGLHDTEKLNQLPLPFDVTDIKAVILTHAHLDHSGYLPKLVHDGFRGPVYCTVPTSRLVKIILEDSASIDDQNLYDTKDVIHALQLIKTLDWNQHIALLGGSISLLPAGHILGASSVKIKADNKSIIFSGDLGRHNDPLIPPPEPSPDADIIVMESTYGKRVRSKEADKELHSFLMKISRESRVGIMASFAVARAQLLITMVHDFFGRHPEDKFRVVLDSPMMIDANQVYKSYAHLTRMPDALKESVGEFEVIAFDRQWKTLAKKEGPLLIISSSGMLTGGRIQRHLKNWQDDEKAILFLPGYQAEGTPGRRFLEGNTEITGDNGEIFNWKGEVIGSEAFSSHADQKELLKWVENVSKDARIYLIHGAHDSKLELQKKLREAGFKNVCLPERSAEITL